MLKSLRHELRRLNKDVYGDLPGKEKTVFEDLCSNQEASLLCPSEENFNFVSIASNRWDKLASIEEKNFLSKITGEVTAVRRPKYKLLSHDCTWKSFKNKIQRLVNMGGETLVEPGDIKLEASNYYHDFLQAKHTNYEEALGVYIASLVDCRCSESDEHELVEPVIAEEVQKVVHYMPTNKASGPDCYIMEFYKKTWFVVGRNLVVAVQSFFAFGLLLKSINSTHLTLAPKTTTTTMMSDFCPITCCNLLYKVISNIIANRLKATLHAAIALNKCAFING
ncbi:hypothetical protein V5N11_027996 [Cardamine amara subsp. amara]|uniref:Reverse transcriptase n=1 Tax=Cardamine amara subsp. amara TaxID=228776 RepID=A0ABD1B5N8_CARAN